MLLKKFSFVFLFISFLSSASFFSSSPEDVSLDFYTAVKNRQYDKAYDYLYTDLLPEYQDDNKYIFMKLMEREYGENLHIKTIRIIDSKEKDDRAVVLVELTSSAGVGRIKVFLVKLSSEWKIIKFQE